MSLYQDLNEGGRYLAEKYDEPDMAKIIDEYCNEVIRDNSDNEIADQYVLKAEKERFEEAGNKENTRYFNAGHIYSGIMYDPELNADFISWYKKNYLTYEDLHDHYTDIDDCINKNFVPGLGTVVISELIANGTNHYDEESVKATLHKIDEDEKNRNRGIQKDENGRSFIDATPNKEFLKSIVKCCYKISRDFSPIQIAQYISKDLPISYEKPVERYFYIDDGDKVMTLTGQNNTDLLDAMYEMLSQTMTLHDDDFGYDEDFYDNLYPKNCDMDISDTKRSFVVSTDNDNDFDYTKDDEKSL